MKWSEISEMSEGNGLGNLNTVLARKTTQISRIELGFRVWDFGNGN